MGTSMPSAGRRPPRTGSMERTRGGAAMARAWAGVARGLTAVSPAPPGGGGGAGASPAGAPAAGRGAAGPAALDGVGVVTPGEVFQGRGPLGVGVDALVREVDPELDGLG